MTYKDICTKREYEVNGEKKVKWYNVGTLRINNDGKEFIELNIFPNTPFYVFEQKKKNNDSVEF